MSVQLLQKKIGATQTGKIDNETLIKTKEYKSLTDEQVCHFFGQTAHETGNFTVFIENLNYSAKSLRNVFRKYFDEIQAQKYERKPQDIANRVYANRMGNGSESSGDGWKYRGRGALQLTGKENYKAFSDFIKVDCVSNPDPVATEYAFDSAFFYFNRNNLWNLCATISDASISTVTQRINGGFHGLDDRKAKTLAYYKLLKE